MIGHNQASFDQVVEENLRRGLYLVHLQALQRCIKDPRLDQRHRLALVALSECTNIKTGMAYPGYAWLAANIVYYVSGEVRRYSEGTIRNTLSELAGLGYLTLSRRAPAAGGRALAHYAITPPSLEELQAEIAKACAAIRAMPKRSFPGSPHVNSSVDVTAGVDVNAGNDIRPADVNLLSADVNAGVAQELVEGTGSATPVPAEPAHQSAPSKPRRSKPRSGISPDWMPTPALIAWVRENWRASDGQIRQEAEKFRNYHIGKGSLQADWAATWRTWWLTGYHRIPRRAVSPASLFDRSNPSSNYDDELAAVRASIAEMREEQLDQH